MKPTTVDFNELWKKLPWKKFRRSLFRLQVRLYKASRANDISRVRNLQKLILRSQSARFLATRQVTQLNQGKKTAGIDGKKSLTFKERFLLSDVLKEEAHFHANSYGFRSGRAVQDVQQQISNNLNSKCNGIKKRILELDIEKCFDRINHNDLMNRVIAPQSIKRGLWKCLKSGVNVDFPEQGTPQGGISALRSVQW